MTPKEQIAYIYSVISSEAFQRLLQEPKPKAASKAKPKTSKGKD